MREQDLARQIKRKGLELGFSRVGITSAADFPDYEAEISSRPDYDLWVNTERGAYLAKGARPRSVYPAARSIICAVYGFGDIAFPEALSRHVAHAYLSRSYLPLEQSACGLRVRAFREYLIGLGGQLFSGLANLPDRAAAARAGVISYGRNNFAYTAEDGSFLILHTFLTDLELPPDQPTVTCDCPPNCRACIEACPTAAILAPGRLHPQSCLLFNHTFKESIPEELRPGLGSYVHGCDICQKVCPRNRRILQEAKRRDRFLEQLAEEFSLEKLLFMDQAYYEDVVRPIMYNYIRDLDLFRRNAAIAMGNSGDLAYLPALRRATAHENPLVREASQWAIARLKQDSDQEKTTN